MPNVSGQHRKPVGLWIGQVYLATLFASSFVVTEPLTWRSAPLTVAVGSGVLLLQFRAKWAYWAVAVLFAWISLAGLLAAYSAPDQTGGDAAYRVGADFGRLLSLAATLAIAGYVIFSRNSRRYFGFESTE